MPRPLLTLIALMTAIPYLYSQTSDSFSSSYFWVAFTDKTDHPNSITHPEAFLSARALARRDRQGVPISEADLPVHPAYLRQLRAYPIHVHHRSRWLNGVTVRTDSAVAEQLRHLPFVASVTYTGKVVAPVRPSLDPGPRKKNLSPIPTPYGYLEPTIRTLRGTTVPDLSRGANIRIAVLDGGFAGLSQSEFFNELHRSQRIVAQRDFVDNDYDVEDGSVHGTQVLSLLAADLEGYLRGTAHRAEYILLKTENARGEYRIEEYNWLVALEYADSLGVDVVNSSLGYSYFSDAEMSYDYQSLDGRSSVVARASRFAYERGMLIVCAAGNSGDVPGRGVDTPADSPYVLTVGAVDPDGELAFFSSTGPTADGRIKPDVVAPGHQIGVAALRGKRVLLQSGTSFAAPLIAGLAAVLWEAFPDRSNLEIMNAIRAGSSNSRKPNPKIGYGIPDFRRSFELLNNQPILSVRTP